MRFELLVALGAVVLVHAGSRGVRRDDRRFRERAGIERRLAAAVAGVDDDA